MSSGSKPKSDPTLDKINQLTLLRLKREEDDLAKNAKERDRLLAAGRTGRASLFTAGYTGPAPGALPVTPLAQVRVQENANTPKQITAPARATTGQRRLNLFNIGPKGVWG